MNGPGLEVWRAGGGTATERSKKLAEMKSVEDRRRERGDVVVVVVVGVEEAVDGSGMRAWP